MKFLTFICFFFLILKSPMAQDNQMSESEQDELVNVILSHSDTLPAEVSGISINQEIPVPEFEWVQVVKGFENLQHQFRNGPIPLSQVSKSCATQEGNKLKVRGFSPDKQFALVENLTGHSGTLCPEGIMFFINVEELTTFDDRYKVRLEQLEKRESLVNQILSAREEILAHITTTNLDDYGELPVEVSGISINQEILVPESEWVELVKDIVNPYYVQTNLAIFDSDMAVLSRRERAKLIRENQDPVIDKAGTRCRVHKGKKLKVLGFSPDAQSTLVESLDGSAGSSCPPGAIFLMDTTNLTANS